MSLYCKNKDDPITWREDEDKRCSCVGFFVNLLQIEANVGDEFTAQLSFYEHAHSLYETLWP